MGWRELKEQNLKKGFSLADLLEIPTATQGRKKKGEKKSKKKKEKETKKTKAKVWQ